MRQQYLSEWLGKQEIGTTTNAIQMLLCTNRYMALQGVLKFLWISLPL